MEWIGYVFIIFSAALIIGLFIIILLKAYYHFEYLKVIYPEKFLKYGNLFGTYLSGEFINHYRVSLILPYFERINYREGENIFPLIRKVKLYVKLTWIFITLNVLYFSTLILIYADFG